MFFNANKNIFLTFGKTIRRMTVRYKFYAQNKHGGDSGLASTKPRYNYFIAISQRRFNTAVYLKRPLERASPAVYSRQHLRLSFFRAFSSKKKLKRRMMKMAFLEKKIKRAKIRSGEITPVKKKSSKTKVKPTSNIFNKKPSKKKLQYYVAPTREATISKTPVKKKSFRPCKESNSNYFLGPRKSIRMRRINFVRMFWRRKRHDKWVAKLQKKVTERYTLFKLSATIINVLSSIAGLKKKYSYQYYRLFSNRNSLPRYRRALICSRLTAKKITRLNKLLPILRKKKTVAAEIVKRQKMWKSKLRKEKKLKKARRAKKLTTALKLRPRKGKPYVTIGMLLGNSKLVKTREECWSFGANEDEKYFDTKLAKDFVDNKKKRFHLFKFDAITKVTTDLAPRKFFFYLLKRDPVYDSFLLEKIISSFTKHGRKEKIRKIFYKIFLSHQSRYSMDTLYYVINSLRPQFINVPVRAGARYYYAPIKAAPFRSTLRAIRFFKMAVLSHKDKKSLEEKILFELENIFEFWGYVNPFYHDYVTISENNKFLAHFRKRRII